MAAEASLMRGSAWFGGNDGVVVVEGLFEKGGKEGGERGGGKIVLYFFAFPLAPLDHSWSSATADLASAAACIWAAASAFC